MHVQRRTVSKQQIVKIKEHYYELPADPAIIKAFADRGNPGRASFYVRDGKLDIIFSIKGDDVDRVSMPIPKRSLPNNSRMEITWDEARLRDGILYLMEIDERYGKETLV